MPDSGLGPAQWRVIIIVAFSAAVCSAHVSVPPRSYLASGLTSVARQMVVSAFIEREPTLVCINPKKEPVGPPVLFWD